MNLLAAVWIFCGCYGTLGAAATDAFEPLFGTPEGTIMSGNGGLTVGVSRTGRWTSCRWPSPGYSDQLSCTMLREDASKVSTLPWHGSLWAVRSGDHLYWLGDPETEITSVVYGDACAPIVEMRGRIGEDGPQFVQTLFVHGEEDIIAIQLDLLGMTVPPKVYWFQNFTPCTRILPELPIGDWLLDGLNDFAVFAVPDEYTICHFRPHAPGKQDWERARQFAREGASPPAWETFKEGVWIAIGAAKPWKGFQCAEDDQPESAWQGIVQGKMLGRSAAVGECQSAMELSPEPLPQPDVGYRATAFLAFGRGREKAFKRLSIAREKGLSGLRQDTIASWAERFAPALRQWGDKGIPLDTLCENLRLIFMAMDRKTNGLARAPITQPPLSASSVQDGAWGMAALDLAGYSDMAEQLTRFYAHTLRSESKRGMPAGTFPATVYTNGSPGAPHVLLSVESSAWWLAMVWRHAEYLENVQRRAYLRSLWPQLALATDFLAGWALPGEDEPLHSFHASAWRDAQSTELVITVFMGFESAFRITRTLGLPVTTDWETRQRGLDSLLRFRIRDQKIPWPIDPFFPDWLNHTISESHPLWEAMVTTGTISGPMSDFRRPPQDWTDPNAKGVFTMDTRVAAQRILSLLIQKSSPPALMTKP